MRLSLTIALLLCGLALPFAERAETAERQNSLSITLRGEPAGKVDGILHTLMGLNLSFDNQLISDSAFYFSLHQANKEGLLQALAHSGNGWWWFDRYDRRYHIRQSIAPQMSELAEVRSHPSSLINRHDLDPLIRELMDPWTQQAGNGLASIPWTGQWSATLPPQGHSQLTSILRLLELGEHAIPSPMPLHDKPPAQAFRAVTAAFTADHDNWTASFLAAAEHFKLSVAIGPAVAQLPDKRITKSWSSATNFVASLADEGFSAQWIAGVLCIDLLPIQRRTHPILNRRVMLLPIPHLVQHADGHLLALELKQATSHIVWAEGGRLCAFIAQPPRLLVAVEEHAVNDILDALDRFERSGGRSWTDEP